MNAPRLTEEKQVLPVVRPVMTTQEAQLEWDKYQELENTLLTDDDYIYFVEWTVGGRASRKTCTSAKKAQEVAIKVEGTVIRRKKKSAFRKMARFFGLSLPSQISLETQVIQLGDKFVKVEKGDGYIAIIYMDKNFGIIKAEHTVTVSHPAGANMIGVAACSVDEGRGFTHPDHDIQATSFTRALNRAISDLIGWGEVSAEEMEAPTEAQVPSASGAVIEGTAKVVTEPGKMTMATFLAEAFKLGYKVDQLSERFGNLSNLDYEKSLAMIQPAQAEPMGQEPEAKEETDR